MEYKVTLTSVTTEEFLIEAMDEYEAVEIAHDMFLEGELPESDRPWTELTFTCVDAVETDEIQSLI